MMSGGRKFLASVLVLACGLAIALIKGDLGPNTLNLLQTVYLGFICGNSAEHLTDMVRNISATKLEAAKLGTNTTPPQKKAKKHADDSD
jgi:hypothetical protein